MTVPGLYANIGKLLEDAAIHFDDKEVLYLHHGKKSFSYRQLNEMVNKYACVLQQAGIAKGDHLAVMLPNCSEFFLIWLALAKLGAVIVPMNIRYRTEEMVYVLNDSDAVGLVIDSAYAHVFKEALPEFEGFKFIFTVGSGAEDLGPILPEKANNAPAEFKRTEVTTDTLMSIQYTSGTTGFPKGCLLTQEYWLTIGMVAGARMKADDIFLCVEPFYYMDPPWELIMCMLKGLTMVAADGYSPSRYMQLVRDHGITVSWALLPAWIYKQPESSLDKDHNLRFLLAGAIPKDIHKPFEKRFNVPLREGYGMTEIGPGIMMPLEDAHMSGSGSVGLPTEFRTVMIVDEDGQEVDRGEVGELWITGPGMFKGYFNKPDATSEVFEGKWFKTGDLFRQDEKGYYYIVGRKKDMIKRSGDNIAAVEVENVLTSHTKIMSAAVVPVPDPDRKEEVKAYIVPAQGETPATIPPEEIIEFCLERLADFKVPRYIEYRDQDLPRTPTGKIQKLKIISEKEDLTEGCFDRLVQ